MIAKALRLTGEKGIRIKDGFYVGVIVNSGTEEEPNEVLIYMNIKSRPDNLIGEEISIGISYDSFVKYPMEDNRTIIISDDVKIA